MSKLVGQGSKYTDDIRTEAAIQYAIKGNLSQIGRDLDIPKATVCEWSKQEWFVDTVHQVRTQNQDSHISRYHALTDKALTKAETALDELQDDLSAGDIKALVVTAATATDKSRLLMNQPTSIKGDSSTVSGLVDQFNKLSQEQDRIRRDHDNIQGSVVDGSHD